MKRFRVRQVNKKFVVWDFLKGQPITVPFDTRSEAERFARMFPSNM